MTSLAPAIFEEKDDDDAMDLEDSSHEEEDAEDREPEIGGNDDASDAPSLSADPIEFLPSASMAPDSFTKFIQDIRKFPMLGDKEEYDLAHEWVRTRNPDVAKKLVTSHLRLVMKIANGYRGYGLPMAELVSEGTMGLMQAVKRFDPEKGVRLSTYAMWWIRGAMQEYILRSWSMVRIAATHAQKKLFFNLRRLKGQLAAYEDRDLSPTDAAQIAESLGVNVRDVLSMNQRLQQADSSLNAPVGRTENGEEGEWQDWLSDDAENQEQRYVKHEDYTVRWGLLESGLADLDEREQLIIKARHLSEDPLSLDVLSKSLNISLERVRQIEKRAMVRLQQNVHKKAAAMGYAA